MEIASEGPSNKTSLVVLEAPLLCDFSGPHDVGGTLAEITDLIHVEDKS